MPDGLSHGDAHAAPNTLFMAAAAGKKGDTMTQPNFHDTGTALVQDIAVAKVGQIWGTAVTCTMSSGPNIGQTVTVIFSKHKWVDADSMVADILAALAVIPEDVSIPDGVQGASI